MRKSLAACVLGAWVLGLALAWPAGAQDPQRFLGPSREQVSQLELCDAYQTVHDAMHALEAFQAYGAGEVLVLRTWSLTFRDGTRSSPRSQWTLAYPEPPRPQGADVTESYQPRDKFDWDQVLRSSQKRLERPFLARVFPLDALLRAQQEFAGISAAVGPDRPQVQKAVVERTELALRCLADLAKLPPPAGGRLTLQPTALAPEVTREFARLGLSLPGHAVPNAQRAALATPPAATVATGASTPGAVRLPSNVGLLGIEADPMTERAAVPPPLVATPRVTLERPATFVTPTTASPSYAQTGGATYQRLGDVQQSVASQYAGGALYVGQLPSPPEGYAWVLAPSASRTTEPPATATASDSGLNSVPPVTRDAQGNIVYDAPSPTRLANIARVRGRVIDALRRQGFTDRDLQEFFCAPTRAVLD